MEVKTQQFKIAKHTFYFRANYRAMIEFENLAKKPVSEISTMKDTLMFVYSGVVAGMHVKGQAFAMSFDDFIDLMDDNFDLIKTLGLNGDDVKKKM